MQYRILVVERHYTERVPLATLLREAYLVNEAHDGNDALGHLDTMQFAGTPCHAVIIGRNTGLMGGVELIERIRVDPSHKSLLVVMYAPLEDGLRGEALRAGADRFLVRPHDRRKILPYLAKRLLVLHQRREHSYRL